MNFVLNEVQKYWHLTLVQTLSDLSFDLNVQGIYINQKNMKVLLTWRDSLQLKRKDARHMFVKECFSYFFLTNLHKGTLTFVKFT